MRVTVTLGLAMLLAAGAVAAGDAKGDLAKGDLAKLQGKWACEREGKKMEIKFTKNDFAIEVDGKDFKGTFKIDPSKKPKEMDLTITEGDKFKGETAHAIYDLDGDNLKWCANKPGQEGRATEFPAQEGEGQYLYLVFKRVKN